MRQEAFHAYYDQTRQGDYDAGLKWGTLATLDKVLDVLTDGAERLARAKRYHEQAIAEQTRRHE